MDSPQLAPDSDETPLRSSHRCTAIKENGERCSVPRVGDTKLCCFHSPRRKGPNYVSPELSLSDLSKLDLEAPGALQKALVGIWQHLLAGSLQPHVAKQAVGVAEAIVESASKGKRASTVASKLAEALRPDPPGEGVK